MLRGPSSTINCLDTGLERAYLTCADSRKGLVKGSTHRDNSNGGTSSGRDGTSVDFLEWQTRLSLDVREHLFGRVVERFPSTDGSTTWEPSTVQNGFSIENAVL